MTERCQRKFTENFDNQKYIIYFAVITVSLTVLYFCRFHFVTLGVSYGLGCLACYLVVNSSYLNKFVDHLKCHFDKNPPEEKIKEPAIKGCVTCGSKDCSRHDEAKAAEPWEGLQIHKQLDQAIEDFYNAILEQFISSWFSRITLQPFFVDELRQQLRYASACLLQRALKIDYAHLITSRLLPCALRHMTSQTGRPPPLHPAAANRDAEMKYLRCVTDAILPHLLQADDVSNGVFRVLIREIFAGWVLLSITDVLADPYILNTIIVLATGDETMAQLPTNPNYKVEFLETFVRQSPSVYGSRARLLRCELGCVLSAPRGLYAVVQHVKPTKWLRLLQFYRDIKSFQSQLLNPEPCASEVTALKREAKLLLEYADADLPLRANVLAELKELLSEDNEDGIKKLQTSRALYEAARQSHDILEKIMLPRFLHSEEFYKMLLGPRVPTGYQKQVKVTKRPSGILRPESIDGQVLDCLNSEEDGSEKMDILNYLDALSADEFHTREHDLSNYKVVLTNVETRLQYPPRRGTVRVFTLAVHRVIEALDVNFWTVERNEHDFHLLRSKLHEFHGDKLLLDLALPSRRDNSPLETLRYKYEDFIQRLLQKRLLQTSELLHLFLTVDGDFSTVVQASTLNANSTDLANLYQSVTYKLKKEKGQHLESFLMNFLFSTDLERFQALKQGSGREVEEAVEVSEDADYDIPSRVRNVRDVRNSVFGDNWGVSPEGYEARDLKHQEVLTGFSQCLMFILTRVIEARSAIWRAVGCVLSRCPHQADAIFSSWLNVKLAEWVSERRLAHFIRLGHNLLFGKKSSPRHDPEQLRTQAGNQLLRCVPSVATMTVGGGLPRAVAAAFTLLQSVNYNKQLVYNLLDLCLMELFPELGATDKSAEPKS